MRILIVQRSLSPPGGGNAVAAWMIHALAAEHDVSTITARDWSTADTNAFYGTAIPERIAKHVIPGPWQWLSALPEDRLTRLRMCSVLCYARPLAATHQLLITADNFAPFSKPGIQYVHFPADLQPEPAQWPALVHPVLCTLRCARRRTMERRGRQPDAGQFAMDRERARASRRRVEATRALPARARSRRRIGLGRS